MKYRKSTSTLAAQPSQYNKSNDSDKITLVGSGGGKGVDGEHLLDVLLLIEDNEEQGGDPKPVKGLTSKGKGAILTVSLSAVSAVSALRMTLPNDLRNDKTKKSAMETTMKALSMYPLVDGEYAPPPLDPVQDMGIVDSTFSELLSRASELRSRIVSTPFHSSIDKQQKLELYNRKIFLLESSRALKQQCRDTQTVAMKEDLRRMKRVLRRLGYITDKGVLETKGRFACELSTGDELVLTDMIFEGVFNDMTPEQAVAILSCFVHKEKSKESRVPPQLQSALRQLQNAARIVAKASIDAKLLKSEDEEEYLNSFNTGLVEVTFLWASGSTFADVCRITEVFEGSIIRSLRRLEELLRQVASACGAIGNSELKSKFEIGAKAIRRGVVFAASLYL